MNTLLTVHSWTRWLVIAVGILALARFALGWLRKGNFTGMDRGLSRGFTGLMDLQVLLGLIFLFWTGFTGAGFPMVRIEHTFTMVAAAVAAHLPLRWRSAPDEIRYRNSLLSFLGSLILVYLGVAVLPGGWSR